MRLVTLLPRWVHTDMFVFLCPHCFQAILSCKRVPMNRWEQWRIFYAQLGEDCNEFVVGTVPECAWTMNGDDFDTMTITPSINAEAAGHWHGHITAGEIVGGSIKEC